MIRKIAISALVVCLAVAMLILPMACEQPKPEKKAIIILPGIMGSNIIDAETGDPLWAPMKKGLKMFELDFPKDLTKILMDPNIKKLINFEGEGGLYEWLDKMKVNPDGTSNHKNTAQVIGDDGMPLYDKASTYGTLEYYEKTYNFLHEKFSPEYDVRMFEYDWRLDNMSSAIALEKFINDHEYTDVTIVAHSMGGVLASTYIARSEENQQKISKFISLGTPFYGSHKAIRVPENPLSLVGDDMSGMVDKIKKILGEAKFEDAYARLLDFVHNLPTIYQLIPYAGMCGAYTEQYPELKDLGIITIDGVAVKSYDEFMTFLKGREFSNDSYVDNMIKWQDEQFVMKDGKKVHASTVVDTRYLVGNDLETELCVNYVDGVMKDCTFSKLGDGTVPLYSATCGLPVTDSKVIEFKGISHGDLSYDDRCLAKIEEIIKEA